MSEPTDWVLMKRGLYYRPKANGYTSNIEEAWRLTEAEADRHVYPHDEPVTKHRAPPTQRARLLVLADKWEAESEVCHRKSYTLTHEVSLEMMVRSRLLEQNARELREALKEQA